MPTGTLTINATTASGAIPVRDASFAIKDKDGRVLYSGLTDENGRTPTFVLDAPPRELSLAPNPNGPRPYSVYDLYISKVGYATINIIDIQIFDGQDAIQPVDMIPIEEGTDQELTFVIPPPMAALPTPPQLQEGPADIPEQANRQIQERERFSFDAMPRGPTPFVLPSVVVPEYITVHLGVPANSAAPNTRVRFIDYIKNVTCSEIYSTWPANSIIANIHVIVTFTLNRIFTEWYRIRGYNFDITNSTTVDQSFVPNRTIYQNISQLVDGIFNVYGRRVGFQNPYFTEYCNGTTVTCKGLSQWGTVTLANRGFTPIQILHNYYPNDLILVAGASGTVTQSYPGVLLQVGSSGENVRRIQNQLNRIRVNYPAIPIISNPNGQFGTDTQAAVRVFQQTFNLLVDGQVGRSTWNKINQIFTSVTRLAELNGEGIRIGLDPNPPTIVIRQGNRGEYVTQAQFILNYISQFFNDIPAPIIDSSFGASTTEAVRAFQRRFGLTADGVIGPNTWRRMYDVYKSLQDQNPPGTVQPPPISPPTAPPFPGTLRQGSTGAGVRTLQELLNNAHLTYNAVPRVNVDGIFGPLTTTSVRTFQLYSGLAVDGIVGPLTWNALTALL